MSILNPDLPWYKIELYDLNANLRHTIEYEPIDFKIKMCLTSNVGTFSLTPPISTDGSTFEYNDVKPYWFAKFQLAWPKELEKLVTFIGRIFHIETLASTELGYRRVYKGRDYGERLQRNFKGYREWINTDASVVVTEVADDLGLGTDKIETDTTDVTLAIDVQRHDSYFNIMKAVSDYWYNASTQIKKDFCVDANGDLVWKSRPWRTSGVETIALSDINSYSLLRDIQSVKNWIHVYGAREKKIPEDEDEWTNWVTPGDHNWVSDSGSGAISSDADEKKCGDRSVKHHMTAADIQNIFHFNYGAETGYIIDCIKYKELQVWVRCSADCTGYTKGTWIRLLDNNGYYMDHHANHSPPANTWVHHVLPLGPRASGWSGMSAFDWSKVAQFKFYFWQPNSASDAWVDWLFCGKRHYYGFASDSTSYNAYGYADLMHIDENLRSDSDCLKRANALCYQKSGVPYRLDFQVPGNPNILIGDRIPITLEPDDLTSVNFDVITVEHVLGGSPLGWRTNATALNTADMRTAPAMSMPEYLVREKLENLQVSKGMLIVR